MRYKLLIIEARIEIRDILIRYLESENYTVLTAENGEAAVVLCQEQTFDLLILDATLPGKSSFEVLSMLRELIDIPILMLSEAVDEENRVFGLKYQPDDYILKPFSVRHVLEKVKEMVGDGGSHDLS